MLLSKTDKIRFKLLYPEYSHNKLAIMFNTNREDIIGVAKGFGIYDADKVKDEPSAELKSEKKKINGERIKTKRVEKEKYHKAAEDLIPEYKVCSDCKKNKHISGFYLRKDMSVLSICKECRIERGKEYVSIIGREAYLEYHREYNRKNKI